MNLDDFKPRLTAITQFTGLHRVCADSLVYFFISHKLFKFLHHGRCLIFFNYLIITRMLALLLQIQVKLFVDLAKKV